jgi:hypothetical protein
MRSTVLSSTRQPEASPTIEISDTKRLLEIVPDIAPPAGKTDKGYDST